MKSNLYVVDDEKKSNKFDTFDYIGLFCCIFAMIVCLLLSGIRTSAYFVKKDIISYFDDNYYYYDILNYRKYVIVKSNKDIYYYDIQYIENDSLYKCEYKIVVDFINTSKVKYFVEFKNDVDYKITYERIK